MPAGAPAFFISKKKWKKDLTLTLRHSLTLFSSKRKMAGAGSACRKTVTHHG